MPIKIPKGFQRRKSSGNVLDEAQATEPTFKVFARPNSEHKNLDMNTARQRPLPGRKNSYEQEDDDLFTVLRPDANNRYVIPSYNSGHRPNPDSGSGGTTNSLSTAPYDSGASSTRLSSSSTNPSSVDTRSDKHVQSAIQTYPTEPPVPPAHQPKSSNGFLRNAGRTFSFGVKSKPPETSEPPVPPVPNAKGRFSFQHGRERAMTASSVSTATPPRLLDSDLPLDRSALDGFENMFDGIGTRSGEPSPIRMLPVEIPVAPAHNQLRPDVVHTVRSAPPRPIDVDRSAQIESSPYSWTSATSRDGLMHTPTSINTVVHNSPQLSSGRAFGNPLRETTALQQVEALTDDNMFADSPSQARIYSRSTRQNAPPPSSFHTVNRHTTSSHSQVTMPGTLLQSSPILEKEDTVFDPSLLASAALATKYQEIKPAYSTPSNKKVMTPAQFERYRQQQDERHRMNKVFKNHKPDSDESDDNYDDAEEDDETERDRQAVKQRKKQEAHLAVYRQTMMKVTGEGPAPNAQPSGSTSNLPEASRSTTDLANQFPTITFDKSPTRSVEDDEDDEVPLGILAAHGFPNKNKPPNRLASSSSNPNLRGVVQQQQQQAPGSVSGESTKRGSLPVFARHLPQDPYYGASLVNQSNRESLAMNSASLMPSGASTAHPHHPAGLVGVIAGEERARAMRRGSPNATTGTFDLPPSMSGHPGMPRAQTTGSMSNLHMNGGVPGMPMMPGMPGMPPMLSPGDQAQIQMSHQMTQMMQMQMQWMQQMQSLMANQGQNSSMPQMHQMLSMPQASPNIQIGANMLRPQSVPLQNHVGSEQRTMSMLSPPSIAGWNNGPHSFHNGSGSTYAPSMAPTERSNIGLASRYRPVSTAQGPEQPWDRRASTMTSTTFRPFSQFGGETKQASSTVRKVIPPADDEDDEQGWAEMKAKKDQKKKTWKLRKGQNVLQELYNGAS